MSDIYVVVKVIEDTFRGTTVQSFGPFPDSASADRYRRRLLAIGVDEYPHPPQRPKVQVTRMEATR